MDLINYIQQLRSFWHSEERTSRPDVGLKYLGTSAFDLKNLINQDSTVFIL